MEIYLQEDGHRVRLATHANFKDFVLAAGLEFFPLGGDPKVLAGCKYVNPVADLPFDVLLLLTTRTHYVLDLIINIVIERLEW